MLFFEFFLRKLCVGSVILLNKVGDNFIKSLVALLFGESFTINFVSRIIQFGVNLLT